MLTYAEACELGHEFFRASPPDYEQALPLYKQSLSVHAGARGALEDEAPGLLAATLTNAAKALLKFKQPKAGFVLAMTAFVLDEEHEGPGTELKPSPAQVRAVARLAARRLPAGVGPGGAADDEDYLSSMEAARLYAELSCGEEVEKLLGGHATADDYASFADAVVAKASGNEAFRAGRVEDAVRNYVRAVKALGHVCAAVYNVSRSAHFVFGEQARVLRLAVAACVLAPDEVVVTSWRLQLMKDDEQECQVVGLKAFQGQIREQAAQCESTCHSMQQLEQSSGVPQLDHRVPNFVREFLAKHAVIPGVDARLARQLLETMHMYTLPWLNFELMVTGAAAAYDARSASFPTQQDVVSRLQLRSLTAPQLQMWLDASAGVVPVGLLSRVEGERVMTGETYPFCNQPHEGIVMRCGTTHVAVGFSDLSTLLGCHLEEESEGKTLDWIGVDSSAYAAAKTFVLAFMLRCGIGTARDVLYLWFSSVVPVSSARAFRRAAQEVLPLLHEGDHPDEVQGMVKAWREARVSAAAARRHWLSPGATHVLAARGPQIGNLAREEDRVAFTRLRLTGELPAGLPEPELTGNVTFFRNHQSAPRSPDQTVLNALPLDVFVEHSRLLAEGQSVDIVQTASELLLQRIEVLRARMMAGSVTTLVLNAVISPDSPVCEFIAKTYKPASMSWSNVCDHVGPYNVFHAMAAACSRGAPCTHYLYSMNWQQVTKGCDIVDYDSPDERAVLLDQGKDSIATLYREMGIDDLFLLPMCANPGMLAGPAARAAMQQVWLEYFLHDSNVDRATVHAELERFTLTSFTNGAMYIQLAYNHG